jgi:hypothetical protein
MRTNQLQMHITTIDGFGLVVTLRLHLRKSNNNVTK